MSEHTGLEFSLKDPYFWGAVLVVFGLMMVIGELFQSGSVSFIGAVLLGVGLLAVGYREYRRRVDAYWIDRE